MLNPTLSEPKKLPSRKTEASFAESRKWQTTNLISPNTYFVHRGQLQQAQLGRGAAREINPSHANEIKFSRIGDPFADFSPLLVTVLQEDNLHLDWSRSKADIKSHISELMQDETVELLGGVEEKAANKKLTFRVFGHQHLFQVRI
jgi:uncharacterized protein (DUF2235 family)